MSIETLSTTFEPQFAPKMASTVTVKDTPIDDELGTTRKQWSSCDFCRKRKKRCDAYKQNTKTVETCTRCRDSGKECTFAFVSQKNVLQSARRKQIRAATKQTRILAATNEVATEAGIASSIAMSNALEYTDNQAISAFESYTGHDTAFMPFSTSAVSVPEELTGGLSASPYDNFLLVDHDFAALESPGLMPMNGHDNSPMLSTSSNELSSAATPEFLWPTYPAEQMAVSFINSASGLSHELEAEMFQDFWVYGHRQMPVVDMDSACVRYKYGLPTPLPKYLLLAMIACGASYSCQKTQPGIGKDLARAIFEFAKQELATSAQTEVCVDMISALVLVSFHWQGDLTQVERNALLNLSVQKIHKLGLHKESCLTRDRSKREIGMLRYMVWLNFIVDAFATTQDLMPGYAKHATPPYGGKEIQINHMEADEMEFMSRDYLTRVPKTGLTNEAIFLNMRFNRAFGSLAKLQNRAVNLQRRHYSVQHLIVESRDWAAQYFYEFDMCKTLLNWEDADAARQGMSFGITSLNFAYWYSSLNIYFDRLQAELDTDNYRIRPADTPPPQERPLDEENILGCYQAITALITLFERLTADHRIFETAQLVRANLFFGGRILQIFYRNHVRYRGQLIVSELLLQRWETCLSIAEVVWGPSARTFDLSRMSLQEEV